MTFSLPSNLRPIYIQSLTPQQLIQSWISVGLSLVVGGMIGLMPQDSFALSPDTAPSELTKLLEKIETAANRQDLEKVMDFYSPEFSHSDGFDRESLEEILAQFWDEFSDVTYEMELQSWEKEGSTLIMTTVTTVTGRQRLKDREFQLEATIVSEQRVEDKQIIQQDVLTESSQLASGLEPPTVIFNVAETAQPEEKFSVDAIVEEPLDNDILLGAALDQSVDINRYFAAETIQMELLNTGGLFKIADAPPIPEDRWISAILMRKGGILSVTQRVRVIDN